MLIVMSLDIFHKRHTVAITINVHIITSIILYFRYVQTIYIIICVCVCMFVHMCVYYNYVSMYVCVLHIHTPTHKLNVCNTTTQGIFC